MSRKWRNILIGVLAVAVLVALIALLNQGDSDYSSKYAGTDLSTDVSGISRSDTYEAYLLPTLPIRKSQRKSLLTYLLLKETRRRRRKAF